MKNQVMPAIDLLLQPSRLLLGALLLIAILSCAAVIIVGIPFVTKLCLLAVIIFTTIYYCLRDALCLLPWSWQRIEVSSAGQLRLTNQRGEQFVPELHASSFIHPQLTILNMSRWTLPAVFLFPQSDAEQHRRVRVWLRWWKHAD